MLKWPKTRSAAFSTSAKPLAGRPRTQKPLKRPNKSSRFRLEDKQKVSSGPSWSSRTRAQAPRRVEKPQGQASPRQTTARFAVASRTSRFYNEENEPSNMKRDRIEDSNPTPAGSRKLSSTPFSSPPLLPKLLSALRGTIGSGSYPFPIQTLSMEHFFSNPNVLNGVHQGSQTLLASETGSGKSIAYLLPVLQSLKSSEEALAPQDQVQTQLRKPRAVILAPTHELSRQLAGYAKSLSHEIKLRTICLSNPTRRRLSEAKDLRDIAEGQNLDVYEGDRPERQPDIMIGTPSRVAQLAALTIKTDEESPAAASRNKGTAIIRPEIGFDAVEWLVIDEADVLFDRDFRQTVMGILEAVRLSRGRSLGEDVLSSDPLSDSTLPFNLILTTATVPASLNSYLHENFPQLQRLSSPNLHRLPKKLLMERVDTAGGNPKAAMHKKLVQIFADESRRSIGAMAQQRELQSRVILFCNRASKATELGDYLEGMGLSNIVMTGSSDGRRRGSNKHLEAFLNVTKRSLDASAGNDVQAPRILITTSLLARGLDFSPSVSHVLIADEPRNEIDFLHRAGRTGRAGRAGTVVVFGKGVTRRGAKKIGFD